MQLNYSNPARLIFLLVLLSFGAAAQDSKQTDAVAMSKAKPPVLTPGGATGRPGGVAHPAARSLPPETHAVRSPGTATAASSNAAQRVEAAGPQLDAMQRPVLERVNLHRALAGLAPVAVDPRLLKAAQSHSNYMDGADNISHYETDKTNPYYTGHSPFDRIDAERYDYVHAAEVIARQPSAHPAAAVDALMTAIYHRFIILSSAVEHAGPGVALNAHHGVDELNVTVDFGAETLPPLLAPSALTLYPVHGHQDVPVDFDSAQEIPSPMPGQTLLGYPVSVQVDPRRTLKVDVFEIYEAASSGRGRALDARLLVHAVDPETPAHAAALISMSPFAPATSYRVVFSGSVDDVTVSRTWQFTTARDRQVTMRFGSPSVKPGASQTLVLDGLDPERGPYHMCYSPARLVKSVRYETQYELDVVASDACESSNGCEVTFMASYFSSCTAPFAKGSFSIAR